MSCRSSAGTPNSKSLRRRLDDARRGRGSVVEIVGDIGVGKSRLVTELTEAREDMRVMRLLVRAVPIRPRLFRVEPHLARGVRNPERRRPGDRGRAVGSADRRGLARRAAVAAARGRCLGRDGRAHERGRPTRAPVPDRPFARGGRARRGRHPRSPDPARDRGRGVDGRRVGRAVCIAFPSREYRPVAGLHHDPHERPRAPGRTRLRVRAHRARPAFIRGTRSSWPRSPPRTRRCSDDVLAELAERVARKPDVRARTRRSLAPRRADRRAADVPRSGARRTHRRAHTVGATALALRRGTRITLPPRSRPSRARRRAARRLGAPRSTTSPTFSRSAPISTTSATN